MLALEKSSDDKDQIIISCKHEAADKVKHLQSTIQVSNLSINTAILYHLCAYLLPLGAAQAIHRLCTITTAREIFLHDTETSGR